MQVWPEFDKQLKLSVLHWQVAVNHLRFGPVAIRMVVDMLNLQLMTDQR